MFKSLAHYYRRLPHYLAHRASPMMGAVFYRWLYSQTVPHRQDAPVIILTMGKTGTVSLMQSLLNSGVLFIKQLHDLNEVAKQCPHRSSATIQINCAMWLMRITHFPWLLRRSKVRIITNVREPISRLVSLCLYSLHYEIRGGGGSRTYPYRPFTTTSLAYSSMTMSHPLVSGYFLANEIQALFDIDVYQHSSPSIEGSTSIVNKQFSLLLMKFEISGKQKEAALSSWLDRRIYITRMNTASEGGYADVYAEFKRRVRIPYRYAEAIYRSTYIKHFYTTEESAKYWQRWEPQLGRSSPLPDWVDDQLKAYPPIA